MLVKPLAHLSDGAASVSIATLNAALDALSTAIDTGSNDQNDSTNGYGLGKSAWGSAFPVVSGFDLYGSHGPGGTVAGNNWISAYASAAAIPADPNETQLPVNTTITAAMGIYAHIAKMAGFLGQVFQGNSATPYTTNATSVQVALLNPASPQSGSIQLASNKSIQAGVFVSSVADGTPPLTSTSHTMATGFTANYVGDAQTGAGHLASTAYGTSSYSGMMPVYNSHGYLDAASIGADTALAASNDTISSNSTIINNLNQLRFLFQQWSFAAVAGGTYQSVPSNLVQGITVTSPWVTTVAGGSNGVNVTSFTGTGTLYVASVYGATASGTVSVSIGTTTALISYTGIDTTNVAFTGCTLVLGSGVLATGVTVTSTANSTTLAGPVGINLGAGLVGTVNNGVLTIQSTTPSGTPVLPVDVAYLDVPQIWTRNQFFSRIGFNSTTPGAAIEIDGLSTTTYAQSSPGLAIRGILTGNAFEWGHSNQAGYNNVIGHEASTGNPFIALNGEAGTSPNTYRTRGHVARIIRHDLLGKLQFGRATNSNADNQAFTQDMILDGSGRLGIGQNPVASNLSVNSLASFASNAAAITGGLGTGDFYRNGDNVCVVH